MPWYWIDRLLKVAMRVFKTKPMSLQKQKLLSIGDPNLQPSLSDFKRDPGNLKSKYFISLLSCFLVLIDVIFSNQHPIERSIQLGRGGR